MTPSDDKKKTDIMGSFARISVVAVIMVYALIVLLCLINPAQEYSVSERRKLAQLPAFSWEDAENGSYTQKLEEYVTDQFPFRDGFRSIKAYFSLGIMQKQDTNGIYVKDGYLCEMEYPMDEESLDRAADIFKTIYAENIEGTDAKAYIALIPDKNYFLNDNDSVLSLDYELFFEKMHEKTSFMQPIEIAQSLKLTDYYKTDTHWRQESIVDTAAILANAMKTPFPKEQEVFSVHTVKAPFYGVYYGQAGLKVPPDEMKYCTSPLFDNCKVYDYENDKEIPLYDLSKTEGRDPYEMFLGGNISLAVIENPKAMSEKELVVFGDSFSRSILPLMAGSYQKITLMDIRYLPSAYVGNYTQFTNQDVLFLYSTSVLNNSITLK